MGTQLPVAGSHETSVHGSESSLQTVGVATHAPVDMSHVTVVHALPSSGQRGG